MKNFKQFQEKLTHISVPLKKVEKKIKNAPGDKPFIQEPGQKPKVLGEEGYDTMKDRILVAGGDPSSKKKKDATTLPVSKEIKKQKGKTVLQKQSEKKYGKGATALDIVRKKITDKHGKGAIMNTKKK